MSHFITKKVAGNILNPHFLTILIWIAGIIGMTAWTIKDVIPLLHDYLYDNVDNRISVIRNDTAWPPNLTVCIPYYSDSTTKIADWLLRESPTNSCVECDALIEHGWDVWSDLNFAPKNTTGQQMLSLLVDGFLDRIVNKSDEIGGLDFMAINRTNFNWNQPLIDAIFVFFSQMMNMDFPYVLTATPTSLSFGSEEVFDRVILKRGLVDQLFEHASSAIRTYYHRITTPDIRSAFRGDIVNAPLERFVFTSQGVCFELGLSSTYHEAFRFLAFPDDPIDPPWMRSAERTSAFSVWMDEMPMYGAGEGRTTDAIYMTADIDWEANYQYIGMDFDVDVKVVETREGSDCVRNESVMRCAMRNVLEEIVAKCYCAPVAYKDLFAQIGRGLPYCTPSRYARCSEQSSPMTKTLFDYRDACSNQCEFVSRRAKHTVYAIKEEQSRDLAFLITFEHVLFSPYVQVSIIEKLSFEGIVSQVGGVVGVFLGFSGLTVVALLVYCIEKVKSRFCIGKGRGEVTNKEGEEVRIESVKKRTKINPLSNMEGFGGVSKRILVTDIARMIQAEQLKMMEYMREERKTILEETVLMIENGCRVVKDEIRKEILAGTKKP